MSNPCKTFQENILEGRYSKELLSQTGELKAFEQNAKKHIDACPACRSLLETHCQAVQLGQVVRNEREVTREVPQFAVYMQGIERKLAEKQKQGSGWRRLLNLPMKPWASGAVFACLAVLLWVGKPWVEITPAEKLPDVRTNTVKQLSPKEKKAQKEKLNQVLQQLGEEFFPEDDGEENEDPIEQLAQSMSNAFAEGDNPISQVNRDVKGFTSLALAPQADIQTFDWKASPSSELSQEKSMEALMNYFLD